jgi:hypothetical protein
LETLAADTRYWAESAAPSTPATGTAVTYVGTDGALHVIDDAGVDTQLGSGVATGTSFPGSPSTGERYRRSDLGYQIYYWDGTYWLSESVSSIHFGTGDQTTSGQFNLMRGAASPPVDAWLTDYAITTYVASPNDATRYWTPEFQKRDASNAPTTVFSVSTQGDTPATWVHRTGSIGAYLDVSSYPILWAFATKVSTPSVLNAFMTVNYRRIAT